MLHTASNPEAQRMQDLLSSAPWQESEIVVYGAPVMQPRRLCYMSDDTTMQYSYSGAQDIKVQPWHPAVLPLKVPHSANSALAHAVLC